MIVKIEVPTVNVLEEDIVEIAEAICNDFIWQAQKSFTKSEIVDTIDIAIHNWDFSENTACYYYAIAPIAITEHILQKVIELSKRFYNDKYEIIEGEKENEV